MNIVSTFLTHSILKLHYSIIYLISSNRFTQQKSMVEQENTMVNGQDNVDLYAVLDISKTATTKEVRNNINNVIGTGSWREIALPVRFCQCVDNG